jgi:hypothetical protein
MKLFVGILVALAVVTVLVAMPVISRRIARSKDCHTSIVTLQGRDGQPLECVCIEGAISTCFNPGP